MKNRKWSAKRIPTSHGRVYSRIKSTKNRLRPSKSLGNNLCTRWWAKLGTASGCKTKIWTVQLRLSSISIIRDMWLRRISNWLVTKSAPNSTLTTTRSLKMIITSRVKALPTKPQIKIIILRILSLLEIPKSCQSWMTWPKIIIITVIPQS